MSDIQRILSDLAHGEGHAAAELLPLVYAELRRLAAHKLAQEKPGQTLQATALVHEAYLRLIGSGAQAHWDGRRHFFAAAAEAMRRILVENARRKRRPKHGGGRRREDVEMQDLAADEADEDLLALEAALQKLGEHDPPKAKLVELRYFAGLTGEQAAEVLGISPSTADRQWAYVRAWLRREMQGGNPPAPAKNDENS